MTLNHRKIRPVFLLFIFTTLFLIQNANAGTTESAWKTGEITIDGNFDDWKNFPTEFNKDLNMVYSITNNDSFLYVMLRFQNPRLARRMNLCGSTLWLNSNNKKKKKLGIRYFNENTPDEESPGRPPVDMQSMDMDPVNRIVKMDGSFTLKNNAFSSPLLDTEFQSVSAFQTGFYCFEYQIPLKDVKSEETGLKIKSGDKFKIGLEIEAMSPEMRKKMKERMKNRRPPGGERSGGRRKGGGRSGGGMGGGRPGGGMGGGRPGGGMGGGRPGGDRMAGDRAKMLENQEIWLTFKLAEQVNK